MEQKLKVGIIGATGYVGQRFITLLADHPWFEIVALCASPRSAGKTYEEAVEGRWKLDIPCPEFVKKMVVYGTDNIEEYCEQIDFTFCAVDMKKDEIRALEEKIAKLETPVVSNNSANRWTEDVPMVIPEINSDHIKLIDAQRQRLGTKRGFIAVKPNCSIQSYVPALTPFLKNGIKAISVCTYQAISGAGKTFKDWPEMEGNVIPFINGEEEKSEKEPLRIWGHIEGDVIVPATSPLITSQCIRVPVLNGHTATAFVKFNKKPSKEELIAALNDFKGLPQEYKLPTAPAQFIRYMEEPDRPQVRLDVDYERGMGISIGRLREDTIYDWKFVGLSHNTLRGAAGGALLCAELLKALGYIEAK
jgi:aspartate-semialdehyde dehydrogenase